MLGPAVTPITLVYAEKVKFIAFTFPAPHLGLLQRVDSIGRGRAQQRSRLIRPLAAV